ncbi:hypothetical protein M1L60_25860 [Actinoplanes sp. TRM 88003]|uniref:Uncharacterized protein n=1 Tax=Paractinoplanes aksuensis TaxID=2939490 RepID=A0ABT1DVP6_9ACTN|nr:hypothetical protein [Actinoplanes aksuensis]MCO8274030.1 hypothetical protein [Actinoplanes aksuensis]
MKLNVHRTISALAVAGALVVSSGGIVAAAAALNAKPLRAEFTPTQQVQAKPLRAE